MCGDGGGEIAGFVHSVGPMQMQYQTALLCLARWAMTDVIVVMAPSSDTARTHYSQRVLHSGYSVLVPGFYLQTFSRGCFIPRTYTAET